MKHLFPENKDVYCNERHSIEQAKEFVFKAKLVGLKVDKDTLKKLVSNKYPYFYWDYEGKTIAQYNLNNDSGDDSEDDSIYVSFEEFKKFLGPIPKTRIEIEKLFLTV